MPLTDEDLSIRANVLARFARRIWTDPQYIPSDTARSPLMALHASYQCDCTLKCAVDRDWIDEAKAHGIGDSL